MYWQDDEEERAAGVQDSVQDLSFTLTGKTLPVEHAYALFVSLREHLPWLGDDPLAGIHSIHVAASGNGWYRPEADAGALLHLSRRTRLVLRLPAARMAAARALTGRRLDVAGHPIELGAATLRPLEPLPTLFARYVPTQAGESEPAFLDRMAESLRALDIRVRKLLCGRSHRIHTPESGIETRSVLVADLPKEQSLALQCQGIGPHRALGCGLFVPHKGIAPVRRADDE